MVGGLGLARKGMTPREAVMEKRVFRSIGYGLYVISSREGDRINGQTANALIQVTSESPQLAFALNKGNLTHEFVEASRRFAVSILSEDAPPELIGRFGFSSGREGDKFSGVKYKLAENGCPVLLEHVVGYLAGEVVKEVDLGTHTLFVGEVGEAEVLGGGEPMTYAYYHRVKRGTTPKAAPTFQRPEKETAMKKYVCTVCGYVYDPEKGDPEGDIPPGTPFEDLPDDWVCPVCGASKDQFEPEE